MNKLKTIDVVKKIQKNLRVKSQIKYQIATLREYADPRLILPHNFILWFVKKTILFFLNPFLKNQVVFNKNTIAILEELSEHVKQLENKINILEKKQK